MSWLPDVMAELFVTRAFLKGQEDHCSVAELKVAKLRMEHNMDDESLSGLSDSVLTPIQADIARLFKKQMGG